MDTLSHAELVAIGFLIFGVFGTTVSLAGRWHERRAQAREEGSKKRDAAILKAVNDRHADVDLLMEEVAQQGDRLTDAEDYIAELQLKAGIQPKERGR
jgi:hypothetical protein